MGDVRVCMHTSEKERGIDESREGGDRLELIF